MEQNIPFREGSAAYLVMKGSLEGGEDGGWADLTVKQIADVLGFSPSFVHKSIKNIEAKTGYKVPHMNGWEERRRRMDEIGE